MAAHGGLGEAWLRFSGDDKEPPKGFEKFFRKRNQRKETQKKDEGEEAAEQEESKETKEKE